jgi:hypothetical protein
MRICLNERMNRLGKFSHLLVSIVFLTTISLDSVAHVTHIDADHELECPLSNNNIVESDTPNAIERMEFSPELVNSFVQKLYSKPSNSLFESRAPPRI